MYVAACLTVPVVGQAQAPQEGAGPAGVALVRRDAEALRPLATAGLTRRFLDATADLPAVGPRTLYRDPARGQFLSEAEADRSGPDARRALTPVTVDETGYYHTRYGSPLAYALPLEVLGRAGVDDLAGRKVLDFGYGTAGHLRLLASLGADVTGVDVDPMLPALYAGPGDQGRIKGHGGPDGRLRLLDGRFPADPAVARAVGGGYDLVLSKNTLKRGYVHPSEPVDPSRRLDLGVDDAAFLRALHGSLKPGGYLLIYNLSPAPAKPGEAYKPMADGRCPFGRGDLEAAGFRVLGHDRDDSGPARAVGRALGWGRGAGAMDLDRDLFALYTLVQRPGADGRARRD
jgi:SAM-dependent methyltransferase